MWCFLTPVKTSNSGLLSGLNIQDILAFSPQHALLQAHLAFVLPCLKPMQSVLITLWGHNLKVIQGINHPFELLCFCFSFSFFALGGKF